MKLQTAAFIIILILASLACSAVVGNEPAPIQGPPEPTCSTEGYNHLSSGEALVAEIEGQELAQLYYEDGILVIISGNQQGETALPEGVHYITFVLIDGETPIAQAQMEVNICLGEFYYREINITPYPSQDA